MLSSIIRRLIKRHQQYESPNWHLYTGDFMAFTMLCPQRLDSIMDLISEVINRRMQGDFVECGTCKGGSAAIIALQAKREGWLMWNIRYYYELWTVGYMNVSYEIEAYTRMYEPLTEGERTLIG